MIFSSPQELIQRILAVSNRPLRGIPEIFEDTSAFMSINEGSVLRLGGNDYLVLGTAREGRFGIDEQPKFWVKSAIDLFTGRRKIIKLVFQETFNSRIGPDSFRCARNPEKEAAVLRQMKGHPNFVQGVAVHDTAGNMVRIIDYVTGPSLYNYLRRLDLPHALYYREMLGRIMEAVIGCIEGIAELHGHGLHHGDIRADHILLNSETDTYQWFDFDYDAGHADYDLFCLGNVLFQVVGKSRHSLYDISERPQDFPDYAGDLTPEDMSFMFRHRVANLRKLFPHISPALNEILMRFSAGSNDHYKDIADLLQDLRDLFPPCQSK